jgi:hypothetical protein
MIRDAPAPERYIEPLDTVERFFASRAPDPALA